MMAAIRYEELEILLNDLFTRYGYDFTEYSKASLQRLLHGGRGLFHGDPVEGGGAAAWVAVDFILPGREMAAFILNFILI
jgi:hypothetical protein